MAQKALGRAFNAAPSAKNVWINLKDVGGISFLCFLTGGVGDTFTLQEAKDAAGTGAQNLPIIVDYFTNTGNASDAWTRRTQAAAATVTTAAAANQNAMVVEILGVSLDDTYRFVKLNSAGAATVAAITSDLKVQRGPANFPAMGV